MRERRKEKGGRQQPTSLFFHPSPLFSLLSLGAPAYGRMPVYTLLLIAGFWMVQTHTAHAQLGESETKKLQAALASAGGASSSSPQFAQQSAVGDAVGTGRFTTGAFVLETGFFAGGSSQSTILPPSDLDIPVLSAKTAPGPHP